MKKYKGITLIELTVVMAIVGVLCVICYTAIKNESNKISQGDCSFKKYVKSESESLYKTDFYYYD